jgi:hypothetical protein
MTRTRALAASSARSSELAAVTRGPRGLTEQARHLRLAGKVETAGAEVLLRELGAANEAGIADAIMVSGELCGAPTQTSPLATPRLGSRTEQDTRLAS